LRADSGAYRSILNVHADCILAAVRGWLIEVSFMPKRLYKPYISPISMFVGLFLWHGLMLSTPWSSVRQAFVALVLVSTWMSATEIWAARQLGKIGTVELPGIRVFIILLSIFLLIGVLWFLSKSASGLRLGRFHQKQADEQVLGEFQTIVCRRHYPSGLVLVGRVRRCLSITAVGSGVSLSQTSVRLISFSCFM